MNKVAYRPAYEADFDATAEIWLESGRLADGAPSQGPTLHQNRIRIDTEIATGWQVRVAVVEDRIVAFLALRPSDFLLDQLFVLPAFQRQSIGKALLEYAKAAMPRLTLRTAAANIRARRFYERADFVVASEGVHPKYGNAVCIYGWNESNRAPDTGESVGSTDWPQMVCNPPPSSRPKRSCAGAGIQGRNLEESIRRSPR